MRPLIVLLAVTALCATLTACNDVYSEKPLFAAADARGAPALKTGIWLQRDAKCQFDDSRPAARWPRCAEWMLVRSGQILTLDSGKPHRWEAYDYLLAGGDARVMQIAAPRSSQQTQTIEFNYIGVEPSRYDPDGQIVEYRQWLIKCGPPRPQPPPDKKGKTTSEPSLTLEPLPGMEPAPDQDHADDCRARDAAAVRNAAKASQAWSVTETWRWVRNGEP